MIVKKSTIIVVSAVSAILVWLSYQQGVNYGLKHSVAMQKPDRGKGMQNGDRGTGGA